MHLHETNESSDDPSSPVPRSFVEYLCSFGPGIVIVLTWLGAGDIVSAGVSGANYGYALMWTLVLAVMVRFVFTSSIAKYQLCNPRSETVLDGLARLHPWYSPLLVLSAVVMAHVYGAYLIVGCGETWLRLTGVGATWQWSLVWAIVALALVFRPRYRRIELVFKLILAAMTVSFVGTAIWVGPNPAGIIRGTFAFALPETVGAFDAMLVAASMVGAVGGSIMNFAYPYFLEQKGWRGLRYRRVQIYDLLLGTVVMIVLNLSVWSLGAELVHVGGASITDLDGLAELLWKVLGDPGRRLLYLGVFAAVFTSLVGVAMVLALIVSHIHLMRQEKRHLFQRDDKITIAYRAMVVWAIVPPLIWTLPGMPDFVFLTLVGNSLQIILVPFLAGGLWRITAASSYIGMEYRNRWWENLVMLNTFLLAIWVCVEIIHSFWKHPL